MSKITYSKQDNDFMATTYPTKSADKWDVTQAGNMPKYDQHVLAAYFGVRLGSKQALALSLTMRPDGSTASQRAWCGDGKQQNNIGGLQDVLRMQHKTAKLEAGKQYKVTCTNGAVFTVTSDRAGHVRAVLVKGPDADKATAPKVAKKVEAAAKAKADKANTTAKPKAPAKGKQAKTPASAPVADQGDNQGNAPAPVTPDQDAASATA